MGVPIFKKSRTPGLSFSKMFPSAKLTEIALSKFGSFAVRRLPTIFARIWCERIERKPFAEPQMFEKLSPGLIDSKVTLKHALIFFENLSELLVGESAADIAARAGL